MAASPIRSHILALERAVQEYPNADAFRVPQMDPYVGSVIRWVGISYSEFRNDVESCARCWSRALKARGIHHRSVVGLWNKVRRHGTIYSIWRAGYIPQTTSFILPDPDAIRDLMERGGAKAIICAADFKPSIDGLDDPFPIPFYMSLSQWPGRGTSPPSMAQNKDDEELPNLRLEEVERRPDEIALLLHTIGSTAGRPKLVPWSFKFVDSIIQKAAELYKPLVPGKQVVMSWLGNVCHGGQESTNIGIHMYGSRIVQPTKLGCSSHELKDMILYAGLNWTYQFSPSFAAHIKKSRNDPQLLQLMKGLDSIEHGGAFVPGIEVAWAMESELKMRPTFSCTECGVIMDAIRGHTSETMLYRPFNNTRFVFLPYDTGEHGAKLVEFAILLSSPDCADVSLCSKQDSHFHSGDLFEEVIPGAYAYRGRNDDWIKLSNAFKCDTIAIENNVKETCSDLVKQCVVVESLRPQLVLLVELDQSKLAPEETIKKEIIARIRHYHSGMLIQEQITDPRMILVVPSHSLPRTATKGNVRRKAAEEKFKAELDEVYG